MPVVKMQNRRIACSKPKGIQWYIEEKAPGRCLARAFLNVRARDEDDWAAAFDRTRMAEGNHLPWRGRPAVQYVHAEVAPDPRDGASAEETLEFAREWAAHWFGSDFEPGRLGCFQVAIGVHDDSENGIMHAHVVVNNTDLITGRRLQINRKDNQGVKHHAQDMARERGWHFFDNTEDGRWAKAEAHLPVARRRATVPMGSPPTIAERRLAERGARAWKDSIRDRVYSSKAISRTEEEFERACEAMGVGVRENEEGDRVYSIEWGGGSKAAAGAGLGRGWKGPGVEGRTTLAMKMNVENARALRGNVLRAYAEMRAWDVRARGLAEHEIASTLMTMHKWGIWDKEGFGAAIEKCGRRLGALQGSEADAARADYARLVQARESAEKMDLLEGLRMKAPDKLQADGEPGCGGRAGGAGRLGGRMREEQKGFRRGGAGPAPRGSRGR